MDFAFDHAQHDRAGHLRKDDAWRAVPAGDPAIRVVLLGWPPGFATIPHHHPHAPEVFEVVEGRLGFRLDEREEVEAGPGTLLLARCGQIHGLRVVGECPLVIAATVAPNLDWPDEVIELPQAWPDWQSNDSRASLGSGR